MEIPEDIKKYVAMAQSLTMEAKGLSQFSETAEDSALQHMGAVLASNCQKLCIGPSFHFHTPENLPSFQEQPKEMEESVTELSDDDEYETVIYKGPDIPYEIVEDTKSKKCVQQNVKFEPMNIRLAETSAEYGELLSPHFFLQSPGMSSPGSSRSTASSSDIAPRSLSSGTFDVNSSENNRCSKTPFEFPKVNSGPNNATEATVMPNDNIGDKLERIEILDDKPHEESEAELVEWPKKFIENKGFCLGVQPGDFYKEESRPCFYVKLPHRSSYEVVVTNNNQLPCDLDLYVNGTHTNALRIPAGASRSIDGPQYSKLAFKLFRVEETPPEKKVTKGDRQNGHIKAVFTPCKIGNSRLRAVSEPLRADMVPERDILDLLDNPADFKKKRAFTVASGGQDEVTRSLDLSRVAEGVTLLQGRKKKRNYVIAPERERDPSKRVVLQLRLIVSLDEEIAATVEEINCLEPPPLPIKRNT